MLRAVTFVTNTLMTTTFELQLNHLDHHHHHYLEDLDKNHHFDCLDDLLRQPSQPPLPSWYRRQSWNPCLRTCEATPKIQFLKKYSQTPSPFLPLVPSFWSRSQCRVLYHCLKLLTSVFNSMIFFSHLAICLFLTRTPKGCYQCHTLFSEKPKSSLERLKNFRTWIGINHTEALNVWGMFDLIKFLK